MKPVALMLLAAWAACGSSTTAWELNSYRDFLAGRLNSLSLTRDGRLTLAPKTDVLFASDQPIIWALAQAPDGSVYAATGHHGRVYRVDPAGKISLVWTAQEPEVFALAIDRQGALYAATSPDGKIYRIETGKASEYFAPGTKYIWALAIGPDGALFAGTGDQGRIFRITAAAKGEIWYETGQSHVTCLAFDSEGRLLAGSEPNGLLYRVAARDKAFVLYDSTLPEIRTIVPGPKGVIYAVALGGSMNRRSLGGVPSTQGVPASASVGTASVTVSVDASQEQQGGVEIKPKPDATARAGAQATTITPATTATAETAGVEKSAIYRINPDNTVESLWSSKEEDAYDLLVSPDGLVFSTDGSGRIYRLRDDRLPVLLTQTNEGEAVRLLERGGAILAATGDAGRIYRLAAGLAGSGSYESPVHDASSVARWGKLIWRAELPAGAHLVFRTRTGNSLRPDATWSDWSAPLTDANGSHVPSPNARYVQWKAEFTSGASGAPMLDSATLAYLPQNNPPAVRSITTVPQPVAAKAQTTAAQASTAAYSVTVTDSTDASSQPSSGTPTQAMTRNPGEQLQVTWQADDPDGDKLVYSLYVRSEDQHEWVLLKSNISENAYSIDADALADGKYFFRVVASDSPANSPENARSAELVSAPVLIDHTPPVVTITNTLRAGTALTLDFEAADAASPLRRCEYSLDAGPWVPLDPVDGILDSPRERFRLHLAGVSPGEHLLVLRATDAAGNSGLAKTVVRQ